MNIHINKEFVEFLESMELFLEEIDKKSDQVMLSMEPLLKKELVEEIKKNTPVDTGRLQSSIELKKSPDNKSFTVQTDVDYAVQVHENTQSRKPDQIIGNVGDGPGPKFIIRGVNKVIVAKQKRFVESWDSLYTNDLKKLPSALKVSRYTKDNPK